MKRQVRLTDNLERLVARPLVLFFACYAGAVLLIGDSPGTAARVSVPALLCAIFELVRIRSEWATIAANVQSGLHKKFLEDVEPLYNAVNMDGKLYLSFQGFDREYVLRRKETSDNLVAEIEKTIEKMYNRHVDVVIDSSEADKKDLFAISVDDILNDPNKIGMHAEVDDEDFF